MADAETSTDAEAEAEAKTEDAEHACDPSNPVPCRHQ